MSLSAAVVEELARAYGLDLPDPLLAALARIERAAGFAEANVRALGELAVEAALFPGQPPIVAVPVDASKMNEPSTPSAEDERAVHGVFPKMNEPSTQASGSARTRQRFLALEGLGRAGISGAALRVGQYILLNLDAQGRGCWSYETLAKALMVSERTVRRACAELDVARPRRAPVRAGVRVERSGRGLIHMIRHGGIGHANVFVPQLERLVTIAAPGLKEPPTVAASSRPHRLKPSASGPQSSKKDHPSSSGVRGRHRARDPAQLELRTFGVVAGADTAPSRATAAIAHGERRRTAAFLAEVADAARPPHWQPGDGISDALAASLGRKRGRPKAQSG